MTDVLTRAARQSKVLAKPHRRPAGKRFAPVSADSLSYE